MQRRASRGAPCTVRHLPVNLKCTTANTACSKPGAGTGRRGAEGAGGSVAVGDRYSRTHLPTAGMPDLQSREARKRGGLLGDSSSAPAARSVGVVLAAILCGAAAGGWAAQLCSVSGQPRGARRARGGASNAACECPSGGGSSAAGGAAAETVNGASGLAAVLGGLAGAQERRRSSSSSGSNGSSSSNSSGGGSNSGGGGGGGVPAAPGLAAAHTSSQEAAAEPDEVRGTRPARQHAAHLRCAAAAHASRMGAEGGQWGMRAWCLRCAGTLLAAWRRVLQHAPGTRSLARALAAAGLPHAVAGGVRGVPCRQPRKAGHQVPDAHSDRHLLWRLW